MGKFLSAGYWFAQNPGSLEEIVKNIFLSFLFILFVGIIVFSVLKRKKGGIYFKIWRSLASFCITNFIVGLFILFFTEQSIPVLSSRFWFLLWAVGIGTWIYFIIKQLLKIPEIKAEREKQKEFNKYIP